MINASYTHAAPTFSALQTSVLQKNTSKIDAVKIQGKPATVKHCIDIFVAHLEEKTKRENMRPKYLSEVKNHLKRLAPLHPVMVTDLTKAKVKAFAFEHLEPLGASRNNRSLSALSCCIDHINTFYDLPCGDLPNPTRAARMKVNPPRTIFVNKDELKTMLDVAKSSASPHLYHFINIAVNTGMRTGEILGAKISYIDFSSNIMTLPKTKNGKQRVIPLNGAARSSLETLIKLRDALHPDNPHVFASPNKTGHVLSIKTSFQRCLKKSGIERHITPHTLRKTAGTYFLRSGFALHEVSSILGHSSLEITRKVYAFTDNLLLTDKIQGFNAVD